MLKIDLYNVLISPIITEKTNNMAEKHNHVAFIVQQKATKNDIKAAMTLAFGVLVKSVNIINYDGKIKYHKRHVGRQKKYKKAYIVLEKGHKFDLISSKESV